VGEAQRPSYSEIDQQFKFGPQFNWENARLFAFQYVSDIDAGTAISIRDTGTVADAHFAARANQAPRSANEARLPWSAPLSGIALTETDVDFTGADVTSSM